MLETLGIAAGQSAINQGLGMLNMDLQEEANKRQAEYQHNLDKKMAEYTYNLTNTTAQMEQLRKNNLNPTLALGKGTGGQTVSTGNASTGSVGMIDNKMSLADAQNMALLEAQRKNIEADTKLKEADANKTSGVDTEEAKARIENINAVIDRIGEEVKNFGVQRKLMNLEATVKEGEIMKIGEEIENLKATNALTKQQEKSLVISTVQSVLTQEMQRAVMRGELKVQQAQINKMAADIALGWEDIAVKKDTNDINQIFNNWKTQYPSLNDWAGGGLQKIEQGVKDLINKIF